ncbi:transporter substrate-binding domain-containing protein [Pseudomonas sp. UL073]|uniref:Transporter substrate-binding domain-containing protein n=1 Tax=Zestomonas insulae TaxID=2809017 RepID=A0ABS2IKQ6_9GAMM|nr:transporter substrate-binding domain-containing protein [Pseudomonas insulae]MBM7062768.1 transporter substrate-binding domain-containing protein [Pseudomonas insulae]
MRRGIGILLGLLSWWALHGYAQDAPPADIRVASEVWKQYTERDGSGLGWDLLRAVYEPLGVQLKTQSVPYTRSIGLVQRGEADAWLGSYADEVRNGVVYPQWHFDADQICTLGLTEQPVVTLASLPRFHLAWMRGYGYERYLTNLTHFQEIQRRDGILSMLRLRHADLFIDARPEIEEVLEGAEDRAAFRVTCLTQLPLYVGFADTAKGRALAALYDRRMAQLVRSGELRPLFARWHYPYPFEEAPHASTP